MKENHNLSKDFEYDFEYEGKHYYANGKATTTGWYSSATYNDPVDYEINVDDIDVDITSLNVWNDDINDIEPVTDKQTIDDIETLIIEDLSTLDWDDWNQD